MEQLKAWDVEYFMRREAKVVELEDLVQSIINIEIEEYLVDAKDVLSELNETAEGYIVSLEKKMQVCPSETD